MTQLSLQQQWAATTADGRMPIWLLTGFLGAGKTTVLNSVLQDIPDSAVIINEYGDVGIDDALVSGERLSVSLLAGGCACCVVSADLRSTLRNLYLSRNDQRYQAFSRVVIETSGIASPSALASLLQADAFLRRHYRLQHVLCVVHGSRIAEDMQRFAEAREQVLMADTVLINRDTLLATGEQAVRAINAQAPCLSWQQAATDWSAVFAVELDRCRITGALLPVAGGAVATRHLLDYSAAPAEKMVSPAHPFCALSRSWPATLSVWPMAALLHDFWQQHQPHCLRIKALLPGERGPLLVQAAGADFQQQWMPALAAQSRCAVAVLCSRESGMDSALDKLACDLDALLKPLLKEKNDVAKTDT